MSVVGDNIKTRRKALKLSQMALAKAAGISQAAISAIESGAITRTPYTDTIGKIAGALGCTVSDLMGDDPKTEKAQEIPSDPLRASVIRDYDRLPPEAQRLVRQYIDLLAKR